MNNLSIILGQRLITIGDVSKGTGLSRGTISAIYHRKADSVQLDTLKKVCNFLQIPLSELVEYEPQKIKDDE